MFLQEIIPSEVIVVDASDDERTKTLVEGLAAKQSSACAFHWVRAATLGAAAQRNEGVALATQSVIWFFDDDIRFEDNCVSRLCHALQGEPQLGGVNAMITNQRYQSPGGMSRFMFTLMNGRTEKSFAGKVIGPAINLLPEDRDDLPDVVPVEWLNTTCTMYRREALPSPPFDSFYVGYSVMEDVTLSLRVAAAGWKLANVRTARIFHDSQPGDHKSDVAARSEMELINRHYVMTDLLKKRRWSDYGRLAIWELFSVVSASTSPSGRKNLVQLLRGKGRALARLVRPNEGQSSTAHD